MKPPIINLGWAENRLASEYIAEISRDPAFKSVERSVTTQLREISVDRLGAGTYYWRVRTGTPVSAHTAPRARLSRSGSISSRSWSRLRSFRRLTGGASAYRCSGKTGSFMFSWTADSQIGSYELAIARDNGVQGHRASGAQRRQLLRPERGPRPRPLLLAGRRDAERGRESGILGCEQLRGGSDRRGAAGGPRVTSASGCGQRMRRA